MQVALSVGCRPQVPVAVFAWYSALCYLPAAQQCDSFWRVIFRYHIPLGELWAGRCHSLWPHSPCQVSRTLLNRYAPARFVVTKINSGVLSGKHLLFIAPCARGHQGALVEYSGLALVFSAQLLCCMFSPPSGAPSPHFLSQRFFFFFFFFFFALCLLGLGALALKQGLNSPHSEQWSHRLCQPPPSL